MGSLKIVLGVSGHFEVQISEVTHYPLIAPMYVLVLLCCCSLPCWHRCRRERQVELALGLGGTTASLFENIEGQKRTEGKTVETVELHVAASCA